MLPLHGPIYPGVDAEQQKKTFPPADILIASALSPAKVLSSEGTGPTTLRCLSVPNLSHALCQSRIPVRKHQQVMVTFTDLDAKSMRLASFCALRRAKWRCMQSVLVLTTACIEIRSAGLHISIMQLDHWSPYSVIQCLMLISMHDPGPLVAHTH